MDIQEKTNEELQQELKDLQQEYNSFKASAIAEIVEYKQTIEALRTSEKRFELLFNEAPLGYQSLDYEGNFIEVNQQWLDTLGYERNEVVGKWFGDFLTTDYQDGFRKRFPVFKAQGHIHSEFEMLHKNGSVLFIAFDGRIGYELNGGFKQTHCILQDITERKQVEESIRESEENLSITLNSIGDGVIATDKEGFVVRMNPVAERLCGWKITDAIGKSLTEVFQIINADTRQPLVNPVKKVLENGETVGLANHTVLISKNGTEYQIADSAAPIRNKDEKISGVVLVFSDVTENYEAQKLIYKSEERYRTLLLNLEAGIVVHAPDTSIVMNNDRASELLGISNDQLKGKTAIDPEWKFVNENNSILEREGYPVNRILSSKKPIRNQTFGIRQPGKNNLVWVNVNGFPLFDGAGQISEIVISFMDITERKQAEIMLRDEKERIRTILDLVGDPIFVKDNDHRIILANRAFLDLFGLDEKDVMGKTLAENIPENEIELFLRIDRSVLDTGIPDYREEELTVGGLVHTIITQKTRFEDESGNRILVCSIHDITERKQSEKALSESEEKYRLLYTSMDQGLALHEIITDENGKPVDYVFLDINDSYTRLFGITREISIGKRIKEVMPKVEQYWIDIFGKVALTGEPNYYENYLEATDRYYSTYSYSPKKNQFAVLVNDITQRKKAEEELITAKDEAQKSDRLKSAFLANMSHEIRTPMNGILGFAELLKNQDITGRQQQEYIDIIKKSGDRMLNIINDIIDISKIESGLMKLDIKESNINEQIDYIYTFFKSEAEAKGMKLSFKTGLSAKEATIKTDREKLYAILTNLVKNAIKYTREGSIEFGCEIAEIESTESLLFYVKDTGIGIPAERQGAIFERFIQADIEGKMAYQGAGLGLAITKSYIDMLGGKIWVESEKGIGATFYFTLPYSAIREENAGVKNDPLAGEVNIPGTNLKILIAEDDEVSEMLLDITVENFSKEILTARTGIEAVELCYNNPDIDLVLMDIQMPLMNGYEATRHIRQFNKNVVIIAQTAYGLSGERERAIESGCNDYIAKPINKTELLMLIKKYFKK